MKVIGNGWYDAKQIGAFGIGLIGITRFLLKIDHPWIFSAVSIVQGEVPFPLPFPAGFLLSFQANRKVQAVIIRQAVFISAGINRCDHIAIFKATGGESYGLAGHINPVGPDQPTLIDLVVQNHGNVVRPVVRRTVSLAIVDLGILRSDFDRV